MKPFNFVYLTTNLLNNKQYVGSHAGYTLNDEYLGSGRYFLKAIKKYGKENFKREILEECETILNARELEEHYINLYNTMYPKGYNLCIKGGLGFNGASLSDYTKDKISIANSGKIRTPEMRDNISKASPRISGENHHFFGKHHSEETIAIIKEKRKLQPEPMLGKHHSNESKQAIAAALIDIPLSESHKESLRSASLNVKKVACEHCGVLFTPWGLKNHQSALKRKNI